MRKISMETDYMQIFVIFLLILIYFFSANTFRPYDYEPGVLFLLTFFHYAATVIFFYMAAIIMKKERDFTFQSFLFTFAYALIPTIIWFVINSWLYAFIPPPRTFSLMGKSFSLVYITFSIAMLSWKIILEYLAVRYATRFSFYSVVYSILFYLVAVIPYSIFMYSLRFFFILFL
ncbi:MAG: hypothetical protein KDC52_18295 [Ignavibacteriae bacterium]|nr:hypothetical protein [Ignavibacteriota bacterium]